MASSRSGRNLWVCLAGGGCRWNLWVCLAGVVVRRYIDFLILLIPAPLVSVLFCSSIPTFCSLKKMYFILVLVATFLFYVLNNFPTVLTHILSTTGVKHGSHMKGVGCRS